MVYIDTNILVYLLEQHPDFSKRVADILEEAAENGETFVTSAITVTEFLAGTHDSTLATLQQVPRLQFVSLDETLAEQAALLERKDGLRIGDAIHLATALKQEVSLLFTHDKQFAKAAQKYVAIRDLEVA